MTSIRAKQYLIVIGLVLLGLIPALAGTMRVVALFQDTSFTISNARFEAVPTPIILHVTSAIPYAWLGALQLVFAKNMTTRSHRLLGKWLWLLALITALSGLWMTFTYPWPSMDGRILNLIRIGVGLITCYFLIIGLIAAMHRQINLHRKAMVYAYALNMGAGTQVLTHIPWFLFPEIQSVSIRAFLMGLGWAINGLIAYWWLNKTSLATSPL